MMLDHILSECDTRYNEFQLNQQCYQQCAFCSYEGFCPQDCGQCLTYVHFPDKVPCGAPHREYDCVHMADFYTCKYSCKDTSELIYALASCEELFNSEEFRILSFGCGPCTDMFAIDYLRNAGLANVDSVEYLGIDYNTKGVWNFIHKNIKDYEDDIYDIRFLYLDAYDAIDKLENSSWKPNFVIFQYVFSDMQKHGGFNYMKKFIDRFAEYFNSQLNSGTVIIMNDINLSYDMDGGREYFDIMADKINGDVFLKGKFNNVNSSNGGYSYGVELSNNKNFFTLAPWRRYSPYDTCSSAQMAIRGR